MIADCVRLQVNPHPDCGGAPTLPATLGVESVRSARYAQYQYLAGTGTLKNENDRCANTCHLLSEFFVCFAGISIS